MTIEELEMEARRANGPTIGVEDIDADLEELGRTVADCALMGLDHWCLDAYPIEVHICGSFARGDAMEKISDLDMRIVLNEAIPPQDEEMIAEDLRTKVGPDLVPEECGFLDARMGNKRPKSESVLIWRSEFSGSDEAE